MAEGATDEVEVRPITPSDTEGVTALVGRCYGDAYPKPVMYRPDELAGLVASGEHGGAVAIAGDRVIGHMAYTWPSPGATVVEAGTTVVDPEWRGKGLMSRLAFALAELLVADGAVGFVHFPTTAHTVMQKASLSAGGRETGIMLAYLPADGRGPGTDGPEDSRLAVTVVYQPVVEAPAREIFLPDRYAGLLSGIAAALGLSRNTAGPLISPEAESRLEQRFEASRALERVSVERIGDELDGRVVEILDGSPARLVHVDLRMDDPGIDWAVERLRPLGFAFAAWLPGWTDCDVLRLQRLADPSEAELSPTLHSSEARSLMELVEEEISGPG